MKKFFKKIGGGIKKAFGKVGKFMDKLGIFGTVAMMFIPIPGLGSIMSMASDALGSVGSMVAKQLAKIPGGQKIVDGANWVLKKARDFSTKGQNAYKNITGAVKDFFEVTGDYVKGKLGVGEKMSFSEAVSEYTGRVRARTQELRDTSKVGAFAETPQELAHREASEAVGATETKVTPGEMTEVSRAGEGKAREMTLDRLTAEPMPEQNEAIRKALEGLDPSAMAKPRQKSLLSDIEIPTTKELHQKTSLRTETDEAIQQAIELAPTKHLLGKQVMDYFGTQWERGLERGKKSLENAPVDFVESQVKSLFMDDEDYDVPAQGIAQYQHQFKPMVQRDPDAIFNAIESDEFVHRTYAPMSPNGMWGAGSTYQNDIAERLRYGTG